MAQTLTKPVFLDETGQDIADKLDDIKDAIISNSGEFVPLIIKVTTSPTKTSYLVGETLDLTGIVVTLIGSNGASYEVTPACTFSPADGTTLTSGMTSVAISYVYPKDSITFTTTLGINVKTLSSIAVTTPPTYTSFVEGDELDLTGIVVTATYDDGSTRVVTSQCEYSPDDGDVVTSSDTEVSISFTEGTVTATTTQSISVVPVYGVEWDGTSTSAWTRTGTSANFVDPTPYYPSMTGTPSSPFDSIYPWSEMEIVSDENAGSLVSIPKFYYKWTKSGTKLGLQISQYQIPGFHVSPAHADRGDGNGERDVVYIGRYKCSTNNYKSVSGDVAKTATKSTFRTNIHDLGSDIWQQDFAMFWTVRMLYLVEYADWDSESKLGPSISTSTQGATDNMPYHTGTTSTTMKCDEGVVQYRYIEQLWGYGPEFIDGIRATRASASDPYGTYVIKNPNDFSDDQNGVNIGAIPIPENTGYAYRISEWQIPNVNTLEYALLPLSILTNDSSVPTTYTCDGYLYSASSSSGVNLRLSVGDSSSGSTKTVSNGGMFWMRFEKTTAYDSVRGRLMKLPNP